MAFVAIERLFSASLKAKSMVNALCVACGGALPIHTAIGVCGTLQESGTPVLRVMRDAYTISSEQANLQRRAVGNLLIRRAKERFPHAFCTSNGMVRVVPGKKNKVSTSTGAVSVLFNTQSSAGRPYCNTFCFFSFLSLTPVCCRKDKRQQQKLSQQRRSLCIRARHGPLHFLEHAEVLRRQISTLDGPTAS